MEQPAFLPGCPDDIILMDMAIQQRRIRIMTLCPPLGFGEIPCGIAVAASVGTGIIGTDIMRFRAMAVRPHSFRFHRLEDNPICPADHT